MEIEFANSQLEGSFRTLAEGIRIWGEPVAKAYQRRVTFLAAAATAQQLRDHRALRLHQLAPPYTGMHSINLHGRWRLTSRFLATYFESRRSPTTMATKLMADSAFHPGEYIQEEIEERGITRRELARQMRRPLQTVNQIVDGKKAITAETALDLECAFGGNAETWLNLQAAYDLTIARQRRAAS